MCLTSLMWLTWVHSLGRTEASASMCTLQLVPRPLNTMQSFLECLSSYVLWKKTTAKEPAEFQLAAITALRPLLYCCPFILKIFLDLMSLFLIYSNIMAFYMFHMFSTDCVNSPASWPTCLPNALPAVHAVFPLAHMWAVLLKPLHVKWTQVRISTTWAEFSVSASSLKRGKVQILQCQWLHVIFYWRKDAISAIFRVSSGLILLLQKPWEAAVDKTRTLPLQVGAASTVGTVWHVSCAQRSACLLFIRQDWGRVAV